MSGITVDAIKHPLIRKYAFRAAFAVPAIVGTMAVIEALDPQEIPVFKPEEVIVPEDHLPPFTQSKCDLDENKRISRVNSRK